MASIGWIRYSVIFAKDKVENIPEKEYNFYIKKNNA